MLSIVFSFSQFVVSQWWFLDSPFDSVVSFHVSSQDHNHWHNVDKREFMLLCSSFHFHCGTKMLRMATTSAASTFVLLHARPEPHQVGHPWPSMAAQEALADAYNTSFANLSSTLRWSKDDLGWTFGMTKVNRCDKCSLKSLGKLTSLGSSCFILVPTAMGLNKGSQMQ